MSEPQNLPPAPEEKAPLQYASPLKRIWAWVGVVYMVILVLLLTYMFSFGAYLRGIGGIMICPAVAGVGASLVYMWHAGDRQSLPRRILLCALVGICAALILMGLWTGIPSLLANFGVR